MSKIGISPSFFKKNNFNARQHFCLKLTISLFKIKVFPGKIMYCLCLKNDIKLIIKNPHPSIIFVFLQSNILLTFPVMYSGFVQLKFSSKIQSLFIINAKHIAVIFSWTKTIVVQLEFFLEFFSTVLINSLTFGLENL